MNRITKKTMACCYYTFFTNGMAVLIIGAILPLLMEDTGISYTIAGGLMSSMAIGNLLSSFIIPSLYQKIGRKKAIITMSSLIPVSFFGLTWMPSQGILYVLMLLIGIGRGCMSNFNNAYVSDHSDGNAAPMNMLHTFFAFGAFLSPFLTSILLFFGFNWRQILLMMVLLCTSSVLSYFFIPKEEPSASKQTDIEENFKPKQKNILRNPHFYCIGLLLFFYLGMENCINGWFVTYLKNTGVMGDSYARNLVSATWLVIMFGRITCAYISKFISRKKIILINCLGSMIAFSLLIATSNLIVITVSLLCLGFFLASIYPSCISDVSEVIRGSASGMAILMGMAALGGIVTPQIIGLIADKVGLVAAISFLAIDVVAMVLFGIWNSRMALKLDHCEKGYDGYNMN